MTTEEQPIDILRQIIGGTIAIEASERSNCNDLAITGKTHKGALFWFVFFVDAGELDYVDNFTINGKETKYYGELNEDDWGDISEPIGALEPLEVEALDAVIISSAVADPEALWVRWRN